MAGGRPPLGPSIVDLLDGPEEAKRRLKTILEVTSGEKTVEVACEELGIERARYYVLQHEALLASVEALTPRAPGRPASSPSPEQERIRELEAKVSDLELDLHAAEIKEELAAVFPHLVERNRARAAAAPVQKKRKKPD
jgi:hypothetical protein